MLSDIQKVAALFTFLGIAFLLLGVILLFDRALLALGNMLFLFGLVMFIGPRDAYGFFVKKSKLRVSICFLSGVVLVVMGWTFIGLVVELYGATGLFYDFLPLLIAFFRDWPYIRVFFRLPGIQQLTDRIVNELPV